MGALTAAGRRYLRRALPAVLAHVAAVIGVAGILAERPHPGEALVYALAVVPAAPLLAAIWATAQYLDEEADAGQRAIQVEALLWAIGVTFGVATVWGVLEVGVGAAHVPSYFAFTVFCIVVVAVQIARRIVGPPRSRQHRQARSSPL